MLLINFKVEMKLQQTNHCVLSGFDADNADASYYQRRKVVR